MTITKESSVDLQEKYEKVRKLIEEDSKLDPASEPYLSKYNAKQLLIGMKANVQNLLRNPSPNTKEHIKLTAMLGTILLNIGKISVETDEPSVGEKHFKKCLNVIAPYETDPEVILVTLHLLNEYGHFWLECEPECSQEYLEKAERLYKDFKETKSIPTDIHCLFQVNPQTDPESCLNSLEKVYTLTQYYLAQVYATLKDTLRSAVYCHATLKRQLELDDYNFIDWALNAATLSQYFIEKNGFKQARHHLAASSYMLEIYQNQLNQITERDEEYEAKMETFKHRSADVARCWAKYGLLLLFNSKERLLHHTEDIDAPCTMSTDLAKLEVITDSLVTREALVNLKFDTLNLTEQENQVTDQFLLTLDDARKVFLNIKMWLERARSYYTLNTLASDYIEILQDQSQMYLNLSFFEDNPENQAKMHKRRVDLMECVLKEINPIYYMRYCRQLWYELAQAYVEIMYIKLEKLKESKDRPSPGTLAKINNLVDKAILYNNTFIYSLREENTIELPETVCEEYVTPFIKAYMSIGALYSRYITLDKSQNLQNIKSSLRFYKKVLDYCSKNPKVQEMMPTEYSICSEMSRLLPVKIAKLEQELPPPEN